MANYFTIQELCKSDTAVTNKIDNTPNATVKSHLNELIKFLNPLREAWGSPVLVTSGYRSKKLNRLVGGSPSSVHMIGYAVDLVPKNGKMTDFKKFDQCIIERNARNSEWIHLGLKSNYGMQRKQIFSLAV